ncbi:hypothetical protein ACLOJK_015617, partial [Asimina triloba]
STLGSMGRVTLRLQSAGSFRAVSGLTPKDGAVRLRHSHKALRDWADAASLLSVSTLWQHCLLGCAAAAPVPTKNAPQGIKSFTASPHDTCCPTTPTPTPTSTATNITTHNKPTTFIFFSIDGSAFDDAVIGIRVANI